VHVRVGTRVGVGVEITTRVGVAEGDNSPSVSSDPPPPTFAAGISVGAAVSVGSSVGVSVGIFVAEGVAVGVDVDAAVGSKLGKARTSAPSSGVGITTGSDGSRSGPTLVAQPGSSSTLA
jgi:hypothetical protein